MKSSANDRRFLIATLVVVLVVAVGLTVWLATREQPPPAEQVAERPVAATEPPPTTAPTTAPPTAPTTAPPEQPAVPVAEELVAPPEVAAAFNKGGCGNCHTIPGVPGANGQVGPDLSSIGAEAATRRSGYTAEEYIRESILDPNAFIAPKCPAGDCPPGVMLQTFAQTLSQEDLDRIVGYLSVLGTEEQATFVAQVPAGPVTLDVSLPAESVLEPFVSLPKDPPSEAQIALGKYLFFDKRLSGNNSLSCASCHQPDKAFTDGQSLSRGYPSTKYFRNTPTLLNTVYADRLYWDGRMDGGDMPTLVRDHLTEAHFMSMDGRLMVERINQVPAYVELFEKAFGGRPSFGKVLKAITAYVQSLNSPPTPYDRYLAGDTAALSEEAQAGLALFEGKAGCSRCHSGPLLSDYGFYNTGVATDPAMFEDPELHLTFRRFFRILGVPNYRNVWEDVGLYALTMNPDDWGKFRTPSLREVARTAPYMHNGSLATLEDVVHFYNQGGGPGQTAGLEPLGLTDAEIAQLVAFLESLSSEPVPVEVPTLPDYELLPMGAVAEAAARGQTMAQPSAPEPGPAEAAGPSAEVVAAFSKGACGSCHVIPGIPGANGQVGPDLSDIGVEAADRRPGYTALEYLKESILDPNAFIAPRCPVGDCPPGAMPPNFGETLSTDELELILNYLSALGTGRK